MDRCNLCGGIDWEPLERAGETTVVRCRCGLVFLHPQPPGGHIQAAYVQEYYRPWEGQGSLRSKIWKDRIAQVIQCCPERGRLLDVGCGTGTFLEVARAEGWEVMGTEFSHYATQVATTKGLSVTTGEVWESNLNAGSFDVITCWHALEHATDPARIVKECHRLLRPGGWLFLATPNVQDHIFQFSYLLAKGHRPVLYEPQERELHLYFFSASTLRNLLTAAEFQVAHVGFDRGAAAVWSKWAVDQVAYWWFRVSGIHWGMALELWARKPAEGTVI